MANHTDRPEVVLLTPTLDGGVGLVTSRLALEMHRREHDVEVWTLARGAFAEETAAQVPIHYLGTAHARQSLFQLIELIRESRPKTILSASYHMNCVAVLAKAFARSDARLVLVEHTSLTNGFATISGLKRFVARMAIRLCYRFADAWIAVSSDAADQMASFAGLPREDVEVIYNPVVTDVLFDRAKESVSHPFFAMNEPVLLAVGRISEEKDYPNMIRAFKKVQDAKPSRLIILGNGPDRGEIESLIAELELTDRVSLAGHTNNPYSYFAKSDLFVLSSQREGLPTVIIEALALGTPVVSTDARSGPREILKDGEYGTLVPIDDSDALADAIVQALETEHAPLPENALLPYTVTTATNSYMKIIAPDKDMEEGTLTSQEYWSDVMDDFIVPEEQDIVFGSLFDAHVPHARDDGVALEVGCVPGMYLAYIAKHFGYQAEGIDYIDGAQEMTSATLGNFGISESTIHEADFFTWEPGKQYDLVSSFGFIEHFTDVDTVVYKHIDLTKPGGTVILEVPNFGGGQYLLHKFLDRKNLDRHNTAIMHPAFFENIAEQNDLEIKYLGYTGGMFDFWWENTRPNVLQKVVRYGLKIAAYVGRRIPFHNQYFSPFLILIATKKEN